MSGNVDLSFGSNHSGVQLGINNGNVNIQSLNVDTLDKLLVARGAELDSYSDQHEDECLHGTRTDLLRSVAEWATSPDGKCIFWLNGMAGTGKSTIARTVARLFPGEHLVAATFFFKRGEADRGNATRLFPTISRQLALKIPGIAPSIRNALTTDPDLGKKSLKVQFEGLLLKPLLELDRFDSQIRMIFIVIDALDECDLDDDVRVILRLLPQLQELRTVRLRMFLTSRPELPIRLGFSKMGNHQYQDLALHDIPEEVTAHDISLFLKDQFLKIQDKKDVPTDWPGEDVIRTLVEMSVPLFISAATVCRYVELKLDPMKELADLIKDQAKYSTKMDKTYLPVLERLLDGRFEEPKDLMLEYFREIVGSIILFADPLPVTALSRFLELEERLISNLLDSFGSVLRLPSDQDQPVQILHQSFSDFLLQTGSQFYIDKGQTHKHIALHCLRTMRAKLKKDICNLNNYGTKRMEIDKGLINHHLKPELQYSCRYWVIHLEQCVDSSMAQEALLFLQQHFLHWVEAMSTLGLASDVVMMITALQMITQEVGGSTLPDFLHDAKRFVLKFQQIANDVPLQLYGAGLIFAPITSIIRQKFIHELPPWIHQLPQVSHQWSAELQTLEFHPSAVHAVAFSPDSRFLASCSGSSEDGSEGIIIQLWDAATGALRQTLQGHAKAVTSIAFSPKGRLLASGSHEPSVWLWNPITGALSHTLGNHPMGVDALAFSPCGNLLATGSAMSYEGEDDTIRLWDTATGRLMKEIEGNSGGVNSLVFSPNGRLLVSGSGSSGFGKEEDYAVRIWNTSTGTLQQILVGHSGAINCVAFSSDGHLFASGSEHSEVRIWDATTGAQKQLLKIHDTVGVTSLAFSPNCQLLASSFSSLWTEEKDDVVRIWDLAAGKPLQILQGHLAGVSSLAFSPDGRQLVSGSIDSTVRLWNPTINQLQPTLLGHQEWVNYLVVSPDGNLLASGSNDGTIRLWNSSTGALIHLLEGHSGKLYDIVFSSDSRILASDSWDQTVRLWDSATGELRHVLACHEDSVHILFSPGGFLLVGRSAEKVIKIWDPTTGKPKQTPKGRIWDPTTHIPEYPKPYYVLSHDLIDDIDDVPEQTLEYYPSHPDIITFSPDVELPSSEMGGLGPGKNQNPAWILLLDRATGEIRQKFEAHSAQVPSVVIPPDFLIASSSGDNNTVRLWGPGLGLLLNTFDAKAFSLIFSPDSQIPALAFLSRIDFLRSLVSGNLVQKSDLIRRRRRIKTNYSGPKRPVSNHSGVFFFEKPQCGDSTINPPQSGFELNIDKEDWICINNERVLWLPVEFRPTCRVVFGGKIAFTTPSGMVYVMEFCANIG